VQPRGARRGLDAQAQIPAAAGQVERELRPVAGIDAKARVAAVERAVEELGPVLDHERSVLRPVAQWAIKLAHEVRRHLGRGRRDLSRHRRDPDQSGRQQNRARSSDHRVRPHATPRTQARWKTSSSPSETGLLSGLHGIISRM